MDCQKDQLSRPREMIKADDSAAAPLIQESGPHGSRSSRKRVFASATPLYRCRFSSPPAKSRPQSPPKAPSRSGRRIVPGCCKVFCPLEPANRRQPLPPYRLASEQMVVSKLPQFKGCLNCTFCNCPPEWRCHHNQTRRRGNRWVKTLFLPSVNLLSHRLHTNKGLSGSQNLF